jgi:acyl-CoA thioester hydrolase
MVEPLELAGPLVGAISYDSAALQTRIARDAEIDDLGHVNNAVYLNWAQDIAIAHWGRLAGRELLMKHVWVVLRHEIDYRDPILAGDAVEVRTWLGRASGPRFERHIDIRKPDARRYSARVLSDWCLLDAATRKPVRVGPEILGAFGVPAQTSGVERQASHD